MTPRRRLATTGLLALSTLAAVGVLAVLAVRGLPGDQDPPTTGNAPAVALGQADQYDDTALLRRRHHLAGQHPLGSPKLADPDRPSPLPAEEIAAAADTAVALTVAYTTRSWQETEEQRDTRLAPLLTEHARAFLAGGSSGAAHVHDQRRRQETTRSQLAYAEPITVTPHQARYLVAVQVTVEDRGSRHTTQQAYAVTVVPAGGTWLVDDLAPASPTP